MRDPGLHPPRWARWLLPVLALRAVLPAGFMPVFDATGGMSLGLCPGVVRAPDASGQHAGHLESRGAHPHHYGDEPSTPGKRPSSTHTLACPFAVAASAAATTVPPGIVPVSLIALMPTPAATDQLVTPSVIRAQSPRAPPPDLTLDPA